MNPDGPGYNMLDFATPLRIDAGKALYFVINFGDSINQPVAVDTRTVLELTPEFGSYSGLSWISSTGTDWQDLFSLGEFEIDPAIFFMKVFRISENLDNAAGINPDYDFTVDGRISTSLDGAVNSIAGLNFFDGGNLELLGPLIVDSGFFNVEDDFATGWITDGGGALVVFGDFLKIGEGALGLDAPMSLEGSMVVAEGSLGILDFTLVPESLLLGSRTSLVITPDGSLFVGGLAGIVDASLLVSGSLAGLNSMVAENSLVDVRPGGVMVFGGALLMSSSSLYLGFENNPQLAVAQFGDAFFVDSYIELEGSMSVLEESALIDSYLWVGNSGVLLSKNLSIATSDLESAGLVSVQNELNVLDSYVDFAAGSMTSATEFRLLGSEAYFAGELAVENDLFLSESTAEFLGGSESEVGSLSMESSDVFVEEGASLLVEGAALVAGDLIVNGDFSAGEFELLRNGFLGGAGLITANFSNSGLVSPGNSIGDLTISGSFTQTSTGVLAMEVESPESFDRVFVRGPATLAGALAIVPIGADPFVFGDTLQGFLQARRITGSFDDVLLPPGFRGRVLERDATLDLLIAPASYTQLATNQNQLNTAQALDSFIPVVSGDRKIVATALDRLTAQEYPSAFNAISPGFFESYTNIGIQQAVAQGQVLQQRFRAIQLGATGFQTMGVRIDPLASKAPSPVEKNPLPEPPAAQSRWNSWVQGNGIFSNSSGIQSMPSYRVSSGGFLVGADYRWGEQLATGLFAGYQGTAVNYDNGGSASINSVRFGGYASYGGATGFFVNGVVSGGASSYTGRRPIEFGSLDRMARSTTGGAGLETLLNSGYNWEIAGWNLGLSATVQYSYQTVEGFTESNAGSLNLAVDRQAANSLRSFLGAQIAYPWQAAERIRLIPMAGLFWQHEFLQYPTDIGASLNGGAGPAFSYSTSTPARDSVFASVGVSAEVGDRWSVNAFYQPSFGANDFVSHVISGGINFEF